MKTLHNRLIRPIQSDRLCFDRWVCAIKNGLSFLNSLGFHKDISLFLVKVTLHNRIFNQPLLINISNIRLMRYRRGGPQVWPTATVVVLEPLIILIKILELFIKLSWLVLFIQLHLLGSSASMAFYSPTEHPQSLDFS